MFLRVIVRKLPLGVIKDTNHLKMSQWLTATPWQIAPRVATFENYK